MALSAYAFIDRVYFNTLSGLSISQGSDEETQLIALINSVTSILEDICNRPLKARDFSYVVGSTAYSEEYAIFDPPPKNIFYFPTWPVNTLTTFMISDEIITAATTYDSTDGYFLYKENGRLTYSLGFDYGYQKNVKAIWNGGYASTHAKYPELQYYTYLMTKKLYEDLQDSESSKDVISETMGNYTYIKASPKELSQFFGLPDIVFYAVFREFRREPIA